MSERAPVVLSEGPLKGVELEAGASDILFLPDPRRYRAGQPVALSDTNPHAKKWVTLFGRRFFVWVPVEVPPHRLAEYIASRLLTPLALGLWRDGEEVLPDGRAEEGGTREGAAQKVPEAPGARHHAGGGHDVQRPGPGRQAG